MGVSKHPLLKSLIIFFVLVFGGVFLLFPFQKSKNPPQNNPPDEFEVSASQLQESSVFSSDGKVKLVMRVEEKKQIKTYSFLTANTLDKTQKLFFTKIASPGAEMLLPHNSWSPDNKYLFLIENEAGSVNVLVFKASGEVFQKGQQYLDLRTLFKSKAGYSISDATGWASPTLIYVTTISEKSTKGPTFWFDLSSHTFIQLAG